MLVVIPLFPRFTALDAVGPYEVLQRIPSIDVLFVGHQRGEVRTENDMLGVTCDAAFDEVSAPDVVVVPGGIGTRKLIHDDVIRNWLQSVHPNTTFTTSVCTGALLLAAAGLLDGLTATTHWRGAELLNELGARYVPDRVVEHLPQRIITSAGVSSGIDMALRLVELLFEYDPQPPFDSGALDKADAATRARADEFLQARK
jgi:putative intracellular protease/amidase